VVQLLLVSALFVAALLDVYDPLLNTLIWSAKNIRRLHCASFLRAKHALYHHSAFEAVCVTVVANPVYLRNSFNPETTLVHRHAASDAEDDLVIILIVADAANVATGVFLGDLGSLVHPDLLQAQLFFLLFEVAKGLSISRLSSLADDVQLVELVEYLLVLLIIPLLLPELYHLHAVSLQFGGVVDVE